MDGFDPEYSSSVISQDIESKYKSFYTDIIPESRSYKINIRKLVFFVLVDAMSEMALRMPYSSLYYDELKH